MCGIFGIWQASRFELDPKMVQKAAASIRHRGPDDEGYLFVDTRTGRHWLAGGDDTPPEVFSRNYPYLPREPLSRQSPGPDCDLALAHRRLAIIDLSPAGHQPLCNEDATIWIIHNGEIYNFPELRKELESRGHRFLSRTDTEVIVHAYEEWGADCLAEFNGMWAFCLWDSRARKLFCSCDHFGIKPFYYFFDGERFVFASEIKALLAAGLPRKANDRIIYDYLDSGLMDHTAETFFAGIRRLRGGEYAELKVESGEFNIKRYWSLNLKRKYSGLNHEEYAAKFYRLFEDSIRLRLISDVPVGTCLSGGIDSSAIVCVVDKLMREQGIKIPGVSVQKTFSARYKDSRHDEGGFIAEVVKKAWVEDHYVYPDGEGLLREVEDLVYHQDEPFGSTSIYAQWDVFKLAAATRVKVTLDGQGGDELLAGYHIYFGPFFAELARARRWVKLFGEVKDYARVHGYSRARGYAAGAAYLLPEKARFLLKSAWRSFAGGDSWINREYFRRFDDYYPIKRDGESYFDGYMQMALNSKSIPSLLRYGDRNSMAHSVESRVPFLDYRLVEFVFSCPLEEKISGGVTKRIFRDAFSGVLPEKIRSRMDKIGFSTPEDAWFRTVMKKYLQDLVSSPSFQDRPYFRGERVQDILELHLQGRKDFRETIWKAVNLELWLRRFID